MSEIISVSSNSDSGAFKIILKAFKFSVVSYVLSILLLAVLAVVVVYTDVSESIVPYSVKAITLFGAFFSAFLTSKTTSSMGWLWGAFAGIINIVLLQLIGTAVMGAKLFSISKLTMALGGGALGMIGGIFGVNIGNK